MNGIRVQLSTWIRHILLRREAVVCSAGLQRVAIAFVLVVRDKCQRGIL